MDFRAIVAGLIFALMWSSAFTSARVIVGAAPPVTALSLRFLISGAIAVGLALMLRQSWRLTPGQWRATILFGLCQNALYLGLNFVAMQWIEASLAAIIASTMPLLVGLLGWIFFRERLRPMGVLGLCIGFAGVALIMGTRLDTGNSGMLGVGMCIVGALALSVATLTLRSVSSGGNLLMVVGLQMLVGSAVLAPIAAVTETWAVAWSWSLIMAFVYTLLMPGLVATLIWFWLVERIGAVRAATFHFLNPFFGVLVAAILLGERMGPWDFAGVGVIMLGILAVQLSKAPPTGS